MSLPEFALVRVRLLLHPPDHYDGWRINQRPPQIGDTGVIVDVMQSPNLPTNYIVESVLPDGSDLWLGDFLEEELQLADVDP